MESKNKRKQIATVISILFFGVFLVVGTATADTLIYPGTGSEVSLTGSAGILDQLYGLNNLQRVPDVMDQVWNWGGFTVYAETKAKYAGFSENFGYIPQNNGGFDSTDFISLFNVPSGTNGLDLGGPSSSMNSGNNNILWALDPSGAPIWTSRPNENSDSLDHMVTWLITGNDGKATNTIGNYVIAWEDLSGAYGVSDRDFNDLVVEVGVGTEPVPEPATMLLFGTGLAGLAGYRKRKAMKK